MLITRLLCFALITTLLWPPANGRQPSEFRGLVTAPAVEAAPQATGPAVAVKGHEPAHAAKRNSRDRRDRDSRSESKKERKGRSSSSPGSDNSALTLEMEGSGDCG